MSSVEDATTIPDAPVAAPDQPIEGDALLGRSLWRLTIVNRRFQIGFAFLTLALLIALLGPAFAPHNPAAIVGAAFQKPTDGLPLGTDYIGRDVLSRVLNGGRSVVWMSFCAASIGMILGAAIGMLAAYSPGWVDNVVMRAMDVIYAFPAAIMALLVVSVLGSSSWLVVMVVAVVWMPQVARVTRGTALDVVRREYVESAEVLGVPRWRILRGEVLPNISSPLLVEYGLRLTWTIGIMATLSFLGIGVQPPTADWGLMINENRGAIAEQPWGVIAPATCIVIFTVGANLIAEGFSRVIAGTRHREESNG